MNKELLAKLLAAGFIMTGAMTLVGCEESTQDEAEDTVESAAEDVEDAMEDAGDEIEDATDGN